MADHAKPMKISDTIAKSKANPEYYEGGLHRPYKEMPMHLPWWGPIPVLIACFLVLKWMIYLKDEKRHGK